MLEANKTQLDVGENFFSIQMSMYQKMFSKNWAMKHLLGDEFKCRQLAQTYGLGWIEVLRAMASGMKK